MTWVSDSHTHHDTSDTFHAMSFTFHAISPRILWKVSRGFSPPLIQGSLRGPPLGIFTDSFSSFLEKVRSVDLFFLSPPSFRSFEWSFSKIRRRIWHFIFTSTTTYFLGTHKTIEKEVVAAMLPLVLDTSRAPHITLFLEFLVTAAHQRITLDQWDSFLQFQSSVNLDLGNYDEDGACKLIFFVFFCVFLCLCVFFVFFLFMFYFGVFFWCSVLLYYLIFDILLLALLFSSFLLFF